MTIAHKTQFRAALRATFAQTIEEVGIDVVKRMSWFGSNDMQIVENIKEAA